ncbi:hypothetical protein AMTRI_Chr11g96900 [Amborella trichopoda]
MATVFKFTPTQIYTLHQNASKTNILHHLDSANHLTRLPISIPRSSTPRTSPFTEKLSAEIRERPMVVPSCSKKGLEVFIWLELDLGTVKALRVIKSANIVLYDRLVSNDIMDLVQPDAKMLYVGKTAGYHMGATVVRLKGGNPLIFGRGGEEMDFLQQQGIHVKVISGITAASGIPAEVGIPLTHRGFFEFSNVDVSFSASIVRFLTGHSTKGGSDPLFIEENAATPDTTLIVYRGLSTLPSLAFNLICRDGFPLDTPSVAVFAELNDLVHKVNAAELVSPMLLIIRKVVALSPLWLLCIRDEALLVEATWQQLQ